MMLLLALAPVLAAPVVDTSAEVTVGWSEYRALWTGDPILGGFDLYSPAVPLDRLLVHPTASVTVRPSAAHRFRLVVDGRTLQRVTLLDDAGEPVHLWTSDGQLLADATRERLFLDEASWRWRPGGDKSLDLRVGVLPYAIAGGRLHHESWPGVRLRLDAQRRGWAPLAAVARAAITPQGAGFGALTVQHEPSSFEHLGLEVSLAVDDRVGIAPMFEDDLGMQVDLWRETSDAFIDAHEDWVLDELYKHYGGQVDGVRQFSEDLETYMALGGSVRMAHVAALGRVLLGRWLLDGAVVGGFGSVTLTGRALPGDATPAEVGAADWPDGTAGEPFSLSFPTRGLAWDLGVDRLLGEHWRVAGFFQGMTGDDDLVDKAVAGEPVTMFLATDHRFTRTRVFPVDGTARGGGWSAPAGVAGHGLVSTGVSVGLAWPRVAASAQLALPLATHPSLLEPHGRIYGVEGDVFVAVRPLPWLGLSAEAGAFQPGTFFLDSSDPTANQLRELPLGWRVYTGLTVSGATGG